MAIQIKLKNSVVQDSTPSTSDLPEVGELAVNGNINSIGGFMRASDNTIVKIFGPGSVTTPTATTTVSGISELATNTETTTGTATNRVVTPAGLNAVTVAERTTSNTNYVAKAGSTLTGVLTMPNGSNSAPAINFGDSDSGIFGGTNTVSLAAGGTTRLTADTGVSVTGTLAVTGAITSTSDLTIADKIIHFGDTNTAIRFPAADTVSVETGGSEALRVDSSQRLLVGTSSSNNVAGFGGSALQVEGLTGATSSMSLIRHSADNVGSTILFGKSRGTSNGATTIVQNNDIVARIFAYGADGTDTQSQLAGISYEVDGTPGANDMPGRLVFSTTADGASSSTERMVIKSDGKIGIGTTSPSSLLHARTASVALGSNGHVYIQSTDSGADIGGQLNFGNNNARRCAIAGRQESSDAIAGYLQFGTRGTTGDITERMRIDSSGRVGIGCTPTAQFAHNLIQIGNQATLGANAALSTTGQTFLTHNLYFDPSGNYQVFNTSNANEGTILRMFDGNFTFSNSPQTTGTPTVTERMRIDSSGRVLIGTTTEGTVDSDDLTIATSGNTGMTIRSGTTSNGAIHFSDATSGAGEYAGYIDYDHNVDKFDMGNNSGRFLSSDSNRVVSIGNASFGGSSGVIGYGSTGGVRKDSILALNASATVAGRGAGVSVGGNSSALGSFYCNKAGNADSDGGSVFLESVGALRFLTGGANDRAIIDSSGKVRYWYNKS